MFIWNTKHGVHQDFPQLIDDIGKPHPHSHTESFCQSHSRSVSLAPPLLLCRVSASAAVYTHCLSPCHSSLHRQEHVFVHCLLLRLSQSLCFRRPLRTINHKFVYLGNAKFDLRYLQSSVRKHKINM